MKNKSLGIIQIDLFEQIKLDGLFNTKTTTDITDIISDKTKQDLEKAFKGEKLAYINIFYIEDSSGISVSEFALCPCSVNTAELKLVLPPLLNDDGEYTHITIYKDNDSVGKFHIYS